jgi:hypothetical protein
VQHNKKLPELPEQNQAMNNSQPVFRREILWEGDADENTVTGSEQDPAKEEELH